MKNRMLEAMLADVSGEIMDAATKAGIDELQQQLAAKIAECGLLTARLGDANTRCDDLQNRLNAEEQECAAHAAECKRLNGELTEWKVKSAGFESALNSERQVAKEKPVVELPAKTEEPRDYEIVVDRGGDDKVRKLRVKFS